jgi:glycosyltransferase involved in cell wall biosynthesis
MEKMNLLVITNNPDRASFRQRIGIYIDTLQNNGIRCRLEKLPASEFGRVSLFRKAGKFDAVLLHKKCLNFIDSFLIKRYCKKIIYDFDDAVMYDESNPEKQSRKRQKSFARTIKLADAVIAGNSYLASQAIGFCENVHILPTGLDVKKYELSEKKFSDGKIRLVWIGSKSTVGYIRELRAVLEQLAKKYPNVALRLICDEFFDIAGMPVEKVVWSQETEAKDLTSSDIGLSPLPDNKFTRGKCGFKILQYQAASLPIVTSPVGVNTEYVEDEKTGFYAGSYQQWLEKIGILIENQKLRTEMGLAGKKHVQNFDCEIIGDRLSVLIKNILQQ